MVNYEEKMNTKKSEITVRAYNFKMYNIYTITSILA